MNSLKVVHGNPTQEELAAVLAVLLSLSRQPDSTDAGLVKPGVREISWSRGGRSYPAPATSWRFAS
ncbi:acyl-CoA carboxylase subunit epsilon [Streptomyces griseorubiginosus]|uniref:acyl-CoA carboxylase subunit epsilon n=1 Tax=Streptomyces griseorubiginosus TaxID=67304 RepID=UPI002E8027C6|nr:acyl-CoA carboxylase subunit epsilon [Streptomyces griseorubiginosus]WUB43695.1 acyl-CoA carboxylase subunit epsilon [Streptomyces griseorubiginosus]WUB52213.1 acyl-CoA carboxylase subunit epsilon [Streptomyces griseorubiginosus]